MNCKSKTEQCMLTQATVELQWGKSEYEKVKVNRNLVTVNFFLNFFILTGTVQVLSIHFLTVSFFTKSIFSLTI